MATFYVGKSDYSNGKTISFTWAGHTGAVPGASALDPFKNTLGHQDYTTLYQGGNAKTVTPGTGLKNVASPTPGRSE